MSIMKLSFINKKTQLDNYLSNCYRRLIRSKIFHFLLLLIEFIILISQEIDIYNRGFKPRYNKKEDEIIISPIIILILKLDKIPKYINCSIIILSMLIFDSFYIILCYVDIKDNYKSLFVIINILELFYFRMYILFFYTLLFTLPNLYFLLAFILSLFHTYLVINNFLYNHLYYYVPEFVDYPYDEFSSMFDIYSFILKIIISIASDSSNQDLGRFFFIIGFVLQIFFCFYFIDKLIHHSYLFMNNSFLNKIKLSLLFAKATIIFISFFILEKNIFSPLYSLINIGIILIYIGFLFFIYEPYSFIYIQNKKSIENILYYLNIINKRNDIKFLIENKLMKHFGNCGLCNLCKKYIIYRTEYDKNIDSKENNENQLLINDKKNIKDKDLFHLLYDGNIKYFKLIRKIEMNYKKFGKNIFNKNVYYYINLLNLMYSDYLNKDITLCLNEKIILEIINQENHSFLENHQIQINQLLLCKEFIFLGKKALNSMKEILKNEQNFSKANKLILLSEILKDMKKKKYKKNLLNNKNQISNTLKYLLITCSIIYEEIFNTTINNSQIPIRDNIQPLEEVFHLSNKNNNIITLELDLLNYNCTIIRAGKGLSSHLNQNFYDLFPNVFKQYQIDLFLKSLFNGFKIYKEKNKQNENNNNKIKNESKKDKTKNEFEEITIIIKEKVSSKTYFKLLNLKITPFFNSDNSKFILFNGTYILNKNTIISVIDLTHRNEQDEIIFGVSNHNLENNVESNLISLKKYISWQSTLGNKLTKINSFQIFMNLYNIYKLERIHEGEMKKIDSIVKNKIKKKESDNISEELVSNDQIKMYKEANSVTSSAQTSSFSKGINSIRLNKVKKDKNVDYGLLNLIKKLIYLSFIIVLFIIIFEYIYYQKLIKSIRNSHNSYINYRGFYRLYYQLFSSILSLSCIPESLDSKNCRNYISIFNRLYSYIYPDKSFDFTEYLLIQNEIYTKKIVEEKSNIIKINEYLGTQRYNELFHKKIKYIQINQNIYNQKTIFTTKEVSLNFFDALLILCNSFVILTENKNTILTQPIYFLNKKDNPFINLINQDKITYYQEEMYKLILNYKYYSDQFGLIDKEMFEELSRKSGLIKIIIFLSISLNTLLFIIIVILIYFFLMSFNKIIIRVLNYVIMITNTNTNNDKFDFKSNFMKKIENLEIILELYKSNPLDAIQNLNLLYYNYNQYLLNQNKNTMIDNKKNIKNTQEEKYVIPKMHKIISKKDINKLKFNNKYYFILNIIILIIFVIFCSFIIYWIDYFSIKEKVYNVLYKNNKLEESMYQAINMYILMIFNNYTLGEMANYMGYSNEDGEIDSNMIFDSFYQDLYLLFDLEKDQVNIEQIYEDFEEIQTIDCTNLFINYHYNIIDKVDEIMSYLNLKERLADLCVVSNFNEFKNLKTIFEQHFQFIKNGMISLTDFSYKGINKNIENTLVGRITFFFFSITIFIIEVSIGIPHKESINKLMNCLWNRILTTEIIFLVFGVAFIIIILFFYIYNINKFCNQIFLLKKTFNILENHE